MRRRRAAGRRVAEVVRVAGGPATRELSRRRGGGRRRVLRGQRWAGRAVGRRGLTARRSWRPRRRPAGLRPRGSCCSSSKAQPPRRPHRAGRAQRAHAPQPPAPQPRRTPAAPLAARPAARAPVPAPPPPQPSPPPVHPRTSSSAAQPPARARRRPRQPTAPAHRTVRPRHPATAPPGFLLLVAVAYCSTGGGARRTVEADSLVQPTRIGFTVGLRLTGYKPNRHVVHV